MTLKQLQYFVTVVQEGSITAAARKLYLSQPPLSAQIRLLEEEFGCTLLERGARKIRLTPEGRLLYEHALTLLELNRITREEMLSASKKERETIRIGIVSSLVCAQASDWIASFSALKPTVHFEITEGNTYQLLKKLESGALHMAVIRSPFPEEGLLCRTLASDTLAAIGQPSFFPEGSREITLAQLSERPLILYRRWEALLTDAFAAAGLTPHYFCVNDDARTTLHFARRAMGIGLAPRSVLPPEERKLTALPITDCPLVSEIKLVTRPGAYLPDGSRAFLEFLYATAAGSSN